MPLCVLCIDQISAPTNGQTRKCLIKELVDGDRILTETVELKEHITNFYKNLFGSEEEPRITLHQDIWGRGGQVSQEDNQELIKPFIIFELEEVVR